MARVTAPTVFAACNSGTGPTDSITTPAAPALASPGNADTAVSLNPTLSWSASPGALTYRVQLSKSVSFASTMVDDSTLSDTSRTVGPLEDTARYYWRVNAKNADGAGAWSTVWSFTTGDKTLKLVLLKPVGGDTFHVGDSVHISFEYRNSTDASHYVTLWFSPNNGLTFDMPVFVYSFHYDGARKDTTWVIPADDGFGNTYVSDQAKIKVEDYTKKATVYGMNALPFKILP
jgi:hypothetical protein